jgi:hypothetical protein
MIKDGDSTGQQKSRWKAATTEPMPDVMAVRASRFDGTVVVTFQSPQRVKLSKADWLDGYGSFATCRNVLIDLLPSNRNAKQQEFTVRWRITAEVVKNERS